MTRIAAALLLLLFVASPALAFDANETFKKGSTVLSIEGKGAEADRAICRTSAGRRSSISGNPAFGTRCCR